MKKGMLLIALFAITMSALTAQDLKLKWSPKIKYDHKGMGDFEEFVGANDKYVYAKYINDNGRNAKTTLVAFDKNTMRKIGSSKILKKSKGRKRRKYERTIVNKNAIYVVYKEDAKGSEKMFVATYSESLRRISPPKMVKKITTSKRRFARFVNNIEAKANYKANDNIYIISEQAAQKGANTKMEFLVLNPKLETVYDGVVEMPVEATRDNASNSGDYYVEEDGKIYATYSIIPTREERRNKEYGYALLNIIDPARDGALVSLPIKSEGRHIKGFSFAGDKKGTLKIFGFYADTDNRKRSFGIDGVFNSILNTGTGEITNSKFTPISSAQLNEIIDDKKDRKRTTRKKRGDQKLSGDYEIETYKLSDDGSLTMFTTHEYNYWVTTTTSDANGNTRTTSRPFCDQTNVTAIKFKSDGTLDWIENIPRSVTYPGHGIDDIAAIETDDKYVVTYGSYYQDERKKGLFKNKKKRKDVSDALEYATFSKQNGQKRKETLVVYNKTKNKKEKNSFAAKDIQAFNNKFYMNGSNMRMRPGIVAASCLTAPVCIGCGIFYVTKKNGSLYKGYNQVAIIEPIR